MYWKKGQRVLASIQQPVIDLIMSTDPEGLQAKVGPVLKTQSPKMRAYITELWVNTGSTFALDMQRRIERVSKKAEGADYWEDQFRLYSRERSIFVTGQVMDTQTRIINNVIDRTLERGRAEGMGVPEMQRLMRSEVTETLTEMNKYQAERIARTEVIGSSNKGSFDAARESGLATKKAWLTSGLEGIRQSHLDNEALGDVEMDYEYTGGIQYPADPEGEPEEIINCRCTVVYNVDEGMATEPAPEPAPEPEPMPQPEPEPAPRPAPEPIPEPPAPEPVPIGQPLAAPEEAVRFNPAATIKEARQWALDNLGMEYVNYGKEIDLKVANQLNESVWKAKKLIPNLKTKGIGSSTKMVKDLKAELMGVYRQSEQYYVYSERYGVEQAERQAKRYVDDRLRRHGFVGRGSKDHVAFSTPFDTWMMPAPRGQYGYINYEAKKYVGVFVNETYGKSASSLAQIVERNQASGWWSKGAPDFRHTVTHELGHEIDHILKVADMDEFKAIFNREHSQGIDYVTQRLSKYGATAAGRSSHRATEMIAEAWAEYITADRPRDLAKEIGDMIMKRIYNTYYSGTGIGYDAWWHNTIMEIGG
jgi:hypothetical protein